MADFLPLPEKEYSVIYADPPWSYQQGGKTKSSHGIAKQHYQTMTTEDICNLPVRKICGGGGCLLSVGNFPKHHRGDQSPGGMGVSIQNRGICVGKEKPKERHKLLGAGCVHSRKCRGVPAGGIAWV